jgi:hypothetical protein
MVHFREVQQFRQPWLWALQAAVGILLGWLIFQQVGLGNSLGNHPAPDSVLLAGGAFYVLMILWLWSVRLVTEVGDDFVAAQFVPMWRARRIALADIERAEAVTYSPLLDYGGWGIRMGRKGWAYNVSGNRGVRIEYGNGKRFLIGSQRAEELARVIQERMAARR